jgi:hypothetical protein
MGQSAGAHIATCALLQQAIKESKWENTYWNVAQIKAYFGLSGGWELESLGICFNVCKFTFLIIYHIINHFSIVPAHKIILSDKALNILAPCLNNEIWYMKLGLALHF